MVMIPTSRVKGGNPVAEFTGQLTCKATEIQMTWQLRNHVIYPIKHFYTTVTMQVHLLVTSKVSVLDTCNFSAFWSNTSVCVIISSSKAQLCRISFNSLFFVLWPICCPEFVQGAWKHTAFSETFQTFILTLENPTQVILAMKSSWTSLGHHAIMLHT